MKRKTLSIVGMAVVLAGLAGPASAAGSGPPMPIPTRPVYLALGDSVATGQYSEPPQDNIRAYWRTIDAYKRDGYVAPFAKFLKHEVNCLPSTAATDTCGDLQLVSLARSAVPESAPGAGDGKPGVTTQLLIDEQLPAAVELIAERRATPEKTDDVKVITLTVGGNELFDAFMGGIDAVQAALPVFVANYTEILATLRAAAGPDVEILTMTYYNPLWYCTLPPQYVREQVAPGADYVLEMMPVPNTDIVGVNGIIEALSAVFGAEPADTYGQLGQGDFFDCKHPNKAGYEKILAAFEAAWADATD